MDNTNHYLWLHPEQWPTSWEHAIDAVRSGRQLTLPSGITIQLRLQRHTEPIQSQLSFYAQYEQQYIKLECNSLAWQNWIASWLSINDITSLPASLQSAAYAVTLEPIGQLFAQVGLATPLLQTNISAPVLAETTSIHIRIHQKNHPELRLAISGLSANSVLQLATNMQLIQPNRPTEPIQFQLAAGYCLQPTTILQNLEANSIFCFDQQADLSQGEIFLITPLSIAKLLQQEDQTFLILDLLKLPLPEHAKLANDCLYAYAGEAKLCIHEYAQMAIGGTISLDVDFYHAVTLGCIEEKLGFGHIVRMGKKLGVQVVSALAKNREGVDGTFE